MHDPLAQVLAQLGEAPVTQAHRETDDGRLADVDPPGELGGGRGGVVCCMAGRRVVLWGNSLVSFLDRGEKNGAVGGGREGGFCAPVVWGGGGGWSPRWRWYPGGVPGRGPPHPPCACQ